MRCQKVSIEPFGSHLLKFSCRLRTFHFHFHRLCCCCYYCCCFCCCYCCTFIMRIAVGTTSDNFWPRQHGAVYQFLVPMLGSFTCHSAWRAERGAGGARRRGEVGATTLAGIVASNSLACQHVLLRPLSYAHCPPPVVPPAAHRPDFGLFSTWLHCYCRCCRCCCCSLTVATFFLFWFFFLSNTYSRTCSKCLKQGLSVASFVQTCSTCTEFNK